MSTAHVIGAGLAGLAAAVRLARSGVRVRLYEAAPQPGGRCRSFFDQQLGCALDNGNHILLGANDAALAYLDEIGARTELFEIAPAVFPFLDLSTGERWHLRPNAGPIPWWFLSGARRAAGTDGFDHLRLAALFTANGDAVVTDRVDRTAPVYAKLVEPLAVAIMNTPPQRAAARPLARVLAATLLRGERACRPAVARHGLSKTFVDPAMRLLSRHGTDFYANARLEQIRFGDARVEALGFAQETVTVDPGDSVILATPAWVSAALVPDTPYPFDHCAIANAHFRLPDPPHASAGISILGLIGATAQWLIRRDDVVTATVSAADALIDQPPEAVLDMLWRDTAAALGCAGPRPPSRLVKERRATFAQTPAAERLRPGAATRWRNLFLAGDWTATGLPATIEGAVRSGTAAATLAKAAMA